MKIAVCIKQVPDTNEIKLDPVTGTLIREGVPSIINHDDKSGIEAALRLAEETEGTVTAVCMGPPQADLALREALAMGCHDAVLVSAREFGGSDTYATATILSAALKRIGYDLVITGRQAIDGDTAQVGPQIAENLGIPQVSYVEKIDLEGEKLIVMRQFEDRYHIIEVKPPCLLTVLQEFAKPRYMSIKGIGRAYKTDIKQFNFDSLKDYLDPAHIGLKGSPTNVFKSFTKQIKGQGIKLTNLSSDEAVKVIMDKLEELHVL
ncbi:MAG: electron transfer flavoprotein subunit beta/FixA family protein [Anaerovoracaceae bacterium]|jgi:electron transfer flavoprotein beta subunit